MAWTSWTDGEVLYAGSLNNNMNTSRNIFLETSFTGNNAGGLMANGSGLVGSSVVSFIGSVILDSWKTNGSIYALGPFVEQMFIYVSGGNIDYRIYQSGTQAAYGVAPYLGTTNRFSGGTIMTGGSLVVKYYIGIQEGQTTGSFGYSNAYLFLNGQQINS